MTTTRVRKDGPRPLSVTEQRWLLEQLLRRQTSEQAAAEPAATVKEASSVIVRPSSTTEPQPGSWANAPGAGSAPVDPTVSPIASPRFAERGVEPSASPARPSEPGAEPVAAAPATPRRAERTRASAGTANIRSPTRSAHRAAPVVDNTKYRAVFACCMQVRDAPTEQSPSS